MSRQHRVNPTLLIAAGCALAVSGSAGICARRWPAQRTGDVRRLQPNRIITTHHAYVADLAFASQADLLASASLDGPVQLWSLRTGRLVRALPGRWRSLAFSPDGKLLLAGGEDGTLAVRRVPTGHVVRKLALHHQAVLSLSWSLKGSMVAAACQDGAVVIVGPGAWRVLKTIPNPLRSAQVPRVLGATAGPVRFSPDGRKLAIVFAVSRQGEPTTMECMVTVWDTRNWTRRATLIDDPFVNSSAVAFSPDGTQLATATETPTAEGDVTIWYLMSLTARSLGRHVRSTNATVFLDRGRQLVAEDAPMVLFDVRTGASVATLSQRSSTYGMAASRDGSILATGDAAGVIRLWSVPPISPVGPRGTPARGEGRSVSLSGAS